MSSVEIRPATAELLEQYYGQMPPKTVRAVVGVDSDGNVIGVGGYYIEGIRAVVFSDMKPEARVHKRQIIKAAHAAIHLALDSGLSPIAVQQSPESETFLKHFGFTKLVEGIYEWHS